jgi:hypothetical protein
MTIDSMENLTTKKNEDDDAALVQQPNHDNKDDSALDTKTSLLKPNEPAFLRDGKDRL